ncbi:3423_t:CDS:2, partial [Acaulospora colombiana]
METPPEAIRLSCKQRDPCLPSRKLNQEIPKTSSKLPTKRFLCNGKGIIIFDRQSRQVSVQLSHQSRHPPYLSTGIPAKWIKFIIERQDWHFSDLLWKAIVEENERNGNGPLLFTEKMVTNFFGRFLVNRKGKGDVYDEIDIDTWVYEGDYIPSPVNDGNAGEDEGPEDEGPIVGALLGKKVK